MNAIAREADPEDNAVSRAHRVGGQIAVECAIVDHLADAPKRRSGNPTWRRRRATPARNHWKRGGSERWDSSIGTRRETASGSRACRPWRKARPARRRRRPCRRPSPAGHRRGRRVSCSRSRPSTGRVCPQTSLPSNRADAQGRRAFSRLQSPNCSAILPDAGFSRRRLCADPPCSLSRNVHRCSCWM